MQDSIIKGTGNSRYLKSAITEATTWEQFRAALIAGTLPIDLAGINAAGWQQIGMAFARATMLSDTTAAKYFASLVGTETVDQVLAKLSGGTLYNPSLTKEAIETSEIALGPSITALGAGIACTGVPTWDIATNQYVPNGTQYACDGAEHTSTNGVATTQNFWAYYASSSYQCLYYILNNNKQTYYYHAQSIYYGVSGTIQVYYFNATAGIKYTGATKVTSALTDLLGSLIAIPSAQLDSQVQIATGSYTGTGSYGSTTDISLDFGINAEILLLFCKSTSLNINIVAIGNIPLMKSIGAGSATIMFRLYTGSTTYSPMRSTADNASDFSTLKLKLDSTSKSQFNNSGDTYVWVALGLNGG